jgi:hypothetical protein
MSFFKQMHLMDMYSMHLPAATVENIPTGTYLVVRGHKSIGTHQWCEVKDSITDNPLSFMGNLACKQFKSMVIEQNLGASYLAKPLIPAYDAKRMLRVTDRPCLDGHLTMALVSELSCNQQHYHKVVAYVVMSVIPTGDGLRIRKKIVQMSMNLTMSFYSAMPGEALHIREDIRARYPGCSVHVGIIPATEYAPLLLRAQNTSLQEKNQEEEQKQPVSQVLILAKPYLDKDMLAFAENESPINTAPADRKNVLLIDGHRLERFTVTFRSGNPNAAAGAESSSARQS